jgi:hypothetical protein
MISRGVALKFVPAHVTLDLEPSRISPKSSTLTGDLVFSLSGVYGGRDLMKRVRCLNSSRYRLV